MNVNLSNKEVFLRNGIVVFDGYCVLCSNTVKSLIKIDKRRKLVFTTLDSDLGKEISSEVLPGSESIVFVWKGQKHVKSEAVLKILEAVGMPWKILTVLKLIPISLRDWLYMTLANNRYRIFGKKEECMIPDKSVRERFIL